jgi:hypothetical protein
MSGIRQRSSSQLAAAAIGLAICSLMASCGPKEPKATVGPPSLRRLTETQYRNIISDLFGPDIKIAGRFDPEIRLAGLLAIGQSVAAVTPAGFEQFDRMAHDIAAQVVDEKHRGALVSCRPADPARSDDACASQFIVKYGRLILRRKLTDQEVKSEVAIAGQAAMQLGDFHGGLADELAGLLTRSEFLFRAEYAERGVPNVPSRLTPYSIAQRLSFLLWNSAPDDALLAAAESGELNTQTGVARQADRLLASPRLENGVRAFFADMLGFEDFDTLSKDAVIFPRTTFTALADSKEQAYRTIIGLLLTRNLDYRDLYSSRHTFLTPALGLVYRVPVANADGWTEVDFPRDDLRAGPRGAGILTQAGFLALHSHPGRSSATRRGRAIREQILCQKVPDPPPNVNFAIVQDTNNPKFKTARDRLTAHRTDPVCAGCHQVTDPIGLALENFDGGGVYRASENGAPIEAGGTLDGAAFTDLDGFAKAIRDNPATTSCVVNRVFAYGTGHAIESGDQKLMAYLLARFAADGYRFRGLLRTVATSAAFVEVMPEPDGGQLIAAAVGPSG